MSWQSDYLEALQARDQREQANKPLIDAYTKLADKSAVKVTVKASTSGNGGGGGSSSSSTSSPQARGSSSSPKPGIPRPLIPASSPSAGGSGKATSSSNPQQLSLSSLQTDLRSAQTARAQLEESVAVLQAERDRARTQLRAEGIRARGLEAERAALAGKLRDRDEELRGKAKLLDDVQNEAVTLNLQLNVTEATNLRLTTENKELIDRWMQHMGREADRMNLESEDKFSKVPGQE